MNRRKRKTDLITVPSRESHLGSAIILLTTGVISLAMVMSGAGGIYMIAALSLLLAIAVIQRRVYAVHLVMFALLLPLPANLGFLPVHWPLNILGPIMLYALIVFVVPGLRRSVHWLKRGRLDAKVLRLIIATAFLSAVALVCWVVFFSPDIKQHIELVPDLPFWAYPLAGVGFAIFNAAMEEAVFRGIIMDALDSALGEGHISVGIQAVPFASFHYLAGFPNGVPGFIMVLIYGILLGAIRRLSKGILAPFVAHVVADITIFSILVFAIFSKP